MKILLATDLSEAAAGASELAAAYAKRAGQDIVLLHVHEPPTALVAQAVSDISAFERALRERSLAALEAQADRLRREGVAVEVRFAEGEASEGITKVAREIGAGLVVVASHARQGLDRLLIGSVAQETLLSADRPILVARPGATPVAFAAWAAGGRPLRVTLGVDRSSASAAAAEWVSHLADRGPLEVRLVHVYSPVLDAIRLRPLKEEVSVELETAVERDLRSFLGPFLDTRKMSLTLRVATARTGAILASEANPAASDLLVVGTSPRRGLRRLWLGATAELVLRRARVPVACVPAASNQVLDAAAREEAGRESADDVC
jgi:nucleotide-binding universal stress UspA family protein